jgi:hypothetical protein
MKNYSILIGIALTAISFIAYAGSPVTLAPFYSAYSYIDQVQKIKQFGFLEGSVLPFLTDETIPTGQKAAVINALAGNSQTKTGALTYLQFVSRKYKMNFQNPDYSKLNSDELFCLGYLTIIDDQGDPENGISLLEMAKVKNPQSYTIQVILALAQAQSLLNAGDECGAWNAYFKVKNDASLSADLEQEAVMVIENEMVPLKNKCN